MNNVADLITILDDHGFTDTDTLTKVNYVNWAITQFCAAEPWPFLEGSASLTFDGTNPTPTNAPSDFRAVRTLNDASTGRKILHERVDNLENAQGMLTTMLSDPLFYYIEGGVINLAPIPPASFVGKLRYLKTHPVVDTSTSSMLIPNRYWMVLVFGALTRLYFQDDDPDTANNLTVTFQNAIAGVRDEIWQQQFDQGDHVIITDPDYLIDYPI